MSHLLAGNHIPAEKAHAVQQRLRGGGAVITAAHVPGKPLQLAQWAERAGRCRAAAAGVQARVQVRSHRPRRKQALQRGVCETAAPTHRDTPHIVLFLYFSDPLGAT